MDLSKFWLISGILSIFTPTRENPDQSINLHYKSVNWFLVEFNIGLIQDKLIITIIIIIINHDATIIWDKVFKNGPSKIRGRPCHSKFYKCCLLQISLAPFLNTLSHIISTNSFKSYFAQVVSTDFIILRVML